MRFHEGRRNEFAGEIKLQFNGMPGGVMVAGDTIPGDKSETEVVFKADAKAKVQGTFLTVDGTATPEGLTATLRLTDWGGRCTSIGQLAPEAPLPLFEMYTRGVHLHIGRAMARSVMPAILDLVAAGRLRPQLVTSATVAWDDAPQALLEPATKLVFSRV